jgi:hypothetical protein
MYDRGVFPDIVGIHPYAGRSQAPDVTIQYQSNFTDIERIRSLMVQYGQGSKPIWVTEWGWSTDQVSEWTQADYIKKSLEMIRDKYTYVTISTLFLHQDQTVYRHGIFRNDYTRKPAATAFQNFMQTIKPSIN